MLLQRILTAVPLAIGMIWIILFQPSHVFFWLVMVFAAIAAYEWAKLAGASIVVQLVSTLAVSAIPWLVLNYASDYSRFYIYAAVAWWIGVCIYLFTLTPKPAGSRLSVKKLLAGVLVIPAAVLAMHAIHTQHEGPEWLLYSLMLVWIADSGAYFSGKRYGRNKLAPAISPGKTLEGLYGAIVTVAVYTLAAAFYFSLDITSTVLLLLLALLLTLVSVAGDLFESVLKREHGVKDSGNILPGHGGVLDRIDSVLAAMPVFASGQVLLLQPVLGA